MRPCFTPVANSARIKANANESRRCVLAARRNVKLLRFLLGLDRGPPLEATMHTRTPYQACGLMTSCRT